MSPRRWGKVHLDAVAQIAPHMTAVAVYAVLCGHAQGRETWPTNEQIAVELSCSLITVRRALAVLLAEGVIKPADHGARFVIVALDQSTASSG